jgi:hypothetical protein
MPAKEGLTRQKSCVPCAKAKRKCDQKEPICGRCTSKSLFCEYKIGRARSPGRNSADDDVQHRAAGNSEAMLLPLDEMDNVSAFPVLASADFQLATPAKSTGICPVAADSFDDDFFGAYNSLLNMMPEIGVMDRARIRYCVKHLKSIPGKLFREGQTPFIHRRAYDPVMPSPLQEAWCAASLYLGKTAENEAMIWDIITTKVSWLVEPRVSWSVSEHLACVQALVIFQIIRLLDGDIHQRADAEQHEETLARWTNQLAIRSGILTSSVQVSPASWDTWVFEEMICRTVIVSRMVQAMFAIQKQGYCTLVAAVTELSFTLQRALWEAPTAIHWQMAMKEKRRYYALHMDFTEAMETATVDDVDDLGLLMMVCYNGVDGVNEWIARTGSVALIG